MAFLNFVEKPIAVATAPHPKYQTTLELALDPESSAALAAALGDLVRDGFAEGNELRVDFPAGWTVFWKLRDGDSRFFLAHPEPDAWVATVAVPPAHLETIRTELLSLQAESRGLLGSHLVSRMNNVEIRVKRA